MLYAGEREAGVMCPHCQTDIARGAEVAQCTRCGTVHHRGCWEGRAGCGSYDCAPGRRQAAPNVETGVVDAVHIPDPMPSAPAGPAWTITAEELNNAVPLPPPRDPFAPQFQPKYTFYSSNDDGGKKINKTALAALIFRGVDAAHPSRSQSGSVARATSAPISLARAMIASKTAGFSGLAT